MNFLRYFLLILGYIGISIVKAELNESCPLFHCATDPLPDEVCSFTKNVNITLKDGSSYQQTVTNIDTEKCEKLSKICPATTKFGNISCADGGRDPLQVDGQLCTNSTQFYFGNCKDNKTCLGIENIALCTKTNHIAYCWY